MEESSREWSAAERAAYRRFVRAHHPDAGGDPETFQAGVARFQARRDQTPPTDRPTERPADRPADRFSGPIVFVTRPRGWRRIMAVLLRTQRRASRHRPPRVR